MDPRTPLRRGAIVKMPNLGQYIIGEQIGAGGLSLIYAAETKNNGYPVIIKEFFPLEYAKRAEKPQKASDGTIIVKKGRVYPEDHYKERFELALQAFEQEGQLGSSARLHNFQVLSFTDCGGGYAVLPRWSADSCTVGELVKKWMRSPPVSVDPVFKDLGRLHFSLTAISSLLSSVSALHEQRILHLDISADNVVWAGQDHTSPTNGSAFLADFGCSVYMENGAYAAEKALSYSEDYAAPEYLQKDGQLTKATDLYSIGRLLSFLCFGYHAFFDHAVLSNLVRRLNIADRFSKQLLAILEKSTAKAARERYQTATEMQKAVNELLFALPLHPINEDCSSAFTLYSLKSMLEGSRDTHYSWAHELCDRRNLSIPLQESLSNPVAYIPSGKYTSDSEFFSHTMPREIQAFFKRKFENPGGITLKDVLSCNYPSEWKDELCKMILNHGSNGIIDSCEGLLHNHDAFHQSREVLFSILSKEDILKSFYNRCNLEGNLHVGLAIILLYALIGGTHFKTMFGDDASQCGAFFTKGISISH